MGPGQHWIFIDLDARDVSDGDGRLGRWFWQPAVDGLFNSLRVSASAERIARLLGGTVMAQTSPLFQRLPLEIFDLIVDHISDFHALWLFTLAVTCKEILALTCGRILAWQRKHRHYGRSGHRFICVGSYTRQNQALPHGVPTVEERQQLDDYRDPDTGKLGATLYHYAYTQYGEHVAEYSEFRHRGRVRELLSKLRYEHSRHNLRSPWSAADFVFIGVLTSHWFPQDRPWALCNISKREYVREREAEALCATLVGDDHEWGALRPTLWHFLLAPTCWSSDYETLLPIDRELAVELTQGRWAGDRFVRAQVDRLEEQGAGPWRDVTGEVFALVDKLWTACISASTSAQ